MTRSYYWKPLDFAKAKNVNPELWDLGFVYRLHREGVIFDSALDIYTGFGGYGTSIRLFLGDRPQAPVYAQSDTRGAKAQVIEDLKTMQVHILHLATAGLQYVNHEIQDSYRLSLEEFVESYFDNPQARPA